jgi:hypothetical protein
MAPPKVSDMRPQNSPTPKQYGRSTVGKARSEPLAPGGGTQTSTPNHDSTLAIESQLDLSLM